MADSSLPRLYHSGTDNTKLRPTLLGQITQLPSIHRDHMLTMWHGHWNYKNFVKIMASFWFEQHKYIGLFPPEKQSNSPYLLTAMSQSSTSATMSRRLPPWWSGYVGILKKKKCHILSKQYPNISVGFKDESVKRWWNSLSHVILFNLLSEIQLWL